MPKLVQYLNNINAIEPIPEMFFNPLAEKLKMYFVTETAHAWRAEQDVGLVQQVLSDI